jgi:hypothetical protein
MLLVPRSRAAQLAVLATPVTLVACVSIAPPIRTGHYGAPGRMQAGMVEAAGGATWADAAVNGGPMVGYGVTDAVALEAGGELGSYDRGIGYLGVRYSPLRPEGRSRAFTLDVEGGAGAGVGGPCSSEDEPCVPWSRPAGGGYLGLGIGGKIKWFSPWLRVRTQLSVAEHVPYTSYTSALAGVQFSIGELAHLYLGTGTYLLAFQGDTYWGWAYLDGGLSFTIATPRTRRLHAQREQTASRRR